MSSPPLSGTHSGRLRALRDALIPLQERVGLPQLVCLVAIAAEPGLSVSELAKRTNTPQGSASRYVSFLLDRYETGEGRSLGQVISQEISQHDPRRRALYLNPKGQEIVESLLLPTDFDTGTLSEHGP